MEEKEFNLSEKRKELERIIKQRENPLLSFGLHILHEIELQDQEFIRLLKEFIEFTHLGKRKTVEFIDKLAGEKLI